MALAAELALAPLGPLQRASADAPAIKLRGDDRERSRRADRGIADDLTVAELDNLGVGGQIELARAPLVTQILQRAIRRAEIGDIARDQDSQHPSASSGTGARDSSTDQP